MTNLTAKYPEVSFKTGNSARSFKIIVTSSGLTIFTKNL